MHRISNELDSDIDPGAFRHEAFYNAGPGRIEMHLVSRRAQSVRVEDSVFEFQEGETIHTENSYKYTIEEFGAMAAAAGFRQQKVWTDDADLFSVQLFRTD